MFSLRFFVLAVALACALAFMPSMRVRSPMGTSMDMAVKKEVVICEEQACTALLRLSSNLYP